MHLLTLALAAAHASCPVHDAVLEQAAARIEAAYVDPDRAPVISAAIRAWSRDGRYLATCDAPEAFAEQFNRDLDAYDGHFHFEPVDASSDGDDWLMQWRAGAPASNAGVREVRVLEGNVGYIRLTTFYPWEIAGDKLAHAWALVADTDGLVLDLRQNGGGEDTAPAQIVRGLVGRDVPSVQAIETRTGRRDDPLPAGALPHYGAPVVVLVDRRTASAAEYVAYALQAEGRATIVGAPTAGAAHMSGEPQPLGHGFQLTLPESRPINRRTGGNWEKVGVRPDLRGGDDPLFRAREFLAMPQPQTP